MITLSTDYSVHFHDRFIEGKENVKMTGDRMEMLMLMLPFVVKDLIAPEVLQYVRHAQQSRHAVVCVGNIP
jgi:hypothetical protein